MSLDDEFDFEHVTTAEKVVEFNSTKDVFSSLLHEIKELSRKKPDAIMSASKVKLVNRVIDNLLTVLKDEPEAKYLEKLDDDQLPQVSDAVLVMVQFEAALKSFLKRYFIRRSGSSVWITEDFVEQLKEEYDEEQEY